MTVKLLTALVLISCVGDKAANCIHKTVTFAIPKVSCQVPRCVGSAQKCKCANRDCEPPTISPDYQRVHFQEPTRRWSENCPIGGSRRPCWEFSFPVSFQLRVTDPSGIGAIGLEIESNVETMRFMQKFWSGSVTSNGETHFTQSMFSLYALPGQRLNFRVTLLCARDKVGNETCTVPKR